MANKTNDLAFLSNDLSSLGQSKNQQQQGVRFLQFSLKNTVTGVVPLIDLQGTFQLFLTDVLPVPQVPEYWLGITNWQGEAIWILDLSQLLGAANWCSDKSFPNSGMVMLVKLGDRTIGLLVEQVKGIVIYDPQQCLSITEVNSAIKLKPLVKGYFLNDGSEASMLLDINSLIPMLKS